LRAALDPAMATRARHIPSHLVVTFWASHNLLDISMGYPHGVS
jgi:hypothetical protein